MFAPKYQQYYKLCSTKIVHNVTSQIPQFSVPSKETLWLCSHFAWALHSGDKSGIAPEHMFTMPINYHCQNICTIEYPFCICLTFICPYIVF